MAEQGDGTGPAQEAVTVQVQRVVYLPVAGGIWTGVEVDVGTYLPYL